MAGERGVRSDDGRSGHRDHAAADLASGSPHRDVGADAYSLVRERTEALARPLSPEDQLVQSMPDVSPTKWHRAHTTWFFETFLLEPFDPDHETFDPAFAYLFNSYYEAAGPRHPRAERGLISRPGGAEVAAYRRHVDTAVQALLSRGAGPDNHILDLLELGLNHEEQHQELLLMDIKHVLFSNPTRPSYRDTDNRSVPAPARRGAGAGSPPSREPAWSAHPGGLIRVGHAGGGFAFDNEGPRHSVHLQPFELRCTPVTNAEWLAFMDDGGYERPELWLSEGWATVRAQGWEAPLYWSRAPEHGPGWEAFTLRGPGAIDPAEPVCHVSYFEADAFARWAGHRLPTEFEWECIATSEPTGPHGTGGGSPNFLDSDLLRPRSIRSDRSPMCGDVWQWTASHYSPYPGFRTAAGAVGEYNGKFMVNQFVLRGGSCVTPAGHVRTSYRNFFPASARWAFSGLRLARD